MEQKEEQISATLSNNAETHSKQASDNLPPEIIPVRTQQEQLLLEEPENSSRNTTLKLCMNINTTDISEITENITGMPTSPLSKILPV